MKDFLSVPFTLDWGLAIALEPDGDCLDGLVLVEDAAVVGFTLEIGLPGIGFTAEAVRLDCVLVTPDREVVVFADVLALVTGESLTAFFVADERLTTVELEPEFSMAISFHHKDTKIKKSLVS